MGPRLKSELRIAKPLLDETNRVVAVGYGFTDEESDFIPSSRLRAGITYDIKYRMGREAEMLRRTNLWEA